MQPNQIQGIITASEITNLDLRIGQAIHRLLGEGSEEFPHAKAPYRKLVDELIDISPAERSEGLRAYQARLVRSLEVLKGCREYGASQYFSRHPTAVGELMTIGSSNSTELAPSDYPELRESSLRFLEEFNKSWISSVTPLLAQRVEKYGSQQLLAEGLTKLVREWFETNHRAYKMLAQPKGSLSWSCVHSDFKNTMAYFRSLNSNAECEKYFAALLAIPASELNQPSIDDYINGIAKHYTAEPAHMQPDTIKLMKGHLSDLALHPMDRSYTAPLKRAVLDLRERFSDLVETPFFVTNNIASTRERF